MKRSLLAAFFGLLTVTLIFTQTSPPQYSVKGTVNLAPSTQLLTAVDPYAKPDRPNPLNPSRPYWYSADATGLKILRLGTNQVLSTISWPTTIDIPLPNGSMLEDAAAPPAGWRPLRLMVPFPDGEGIGPEAVSGATFLAFVEMAHSGYEWRSSDGRFRDLIAPMASEATESSMLVMIDITDPANPSIVAGAILGHEAGQMAWEPGAGAMYVANMPSTSLPSHLASFISKITPPEVGAEPAPPYAPETLYPLCGPEIQWSGEAKEEAKTGIPVNVPEVWACDAIHGAGEGEGPFTYKFAGLPTWLTAHGIDPTTGESDGFLYGTPTQVGSYSFMVTVTDHAAGIGDPKTASAVFTIDVKPTVTEFAAGEMEVEAGTTTAVPLWGTGSCAVVPGATPVPAWFEVLTVPNGCIAIMNTPPLQGEYYNFVMPNFTRIDTRTGQAYPGPWVLSAEVLGTYGFDSLPAGVGLSGLAWHEIDMIPGEPDKYVLNSEFIGIDAVTGQLYKDVLPYEESDTIEEVGPGSMVVETNVVTAEGLPRIGPLKAARPDIAIAANQKVFGDLLVEADRDIFVSVPIAGPTGTGGALMKVRASMSSTINLPGVQAFYLALDSDLEPAVPPSLGGIGQIDHGVLWATGPGSGNVAVINTTAGTLHQTLAVAGATSLGGVSVDSVSTGLAYVAAPAPGSVTLFGSGAVWQTPPMLATINPAEAIVDPTVMTVGEPGSATVIAIGWPTPTLGVSGALPTGMFFRDNGNGTLTVYGTPSVAGTFTLTATATNAAGIATQAFTLTVNPRTRPTITSANTATLVVGIAGQFKVEATGTPTPKLSVSGVLPGGLSFHDNAACSPAIPVGCTGSAFLGGLATSTGTYPLTITVANTEGTATQNFILYVSATAPTPLSPSITTHPANQTVNEGQMATFSVVATSTTPMTYQWRRAGVNIPGATSASYTLSATRLDNLASFDVVVSNSVGSVTSNTATLTVNLLGSPLVTTASLPDGTVNVAYSYQLTAVGGTQPYTWTMAKIPQNSLPQGLILSSSGSISGKANKAGSYSFTVEVKDAAARTGNRTLGLKFADEGGLIKEGTIKISLEAGSEPEGIAVNPVTHNAYILSRDMATGLKTVVVMDNTALNGGAPKKVPMPLGAAQKSPKLIPIANDHEYLAIDSTRNLIYVPTKYAAPYTPEPGEPPEENDEPTAGVMGTLTVIDGNTNKVLTFYQFAEGVMPEATAVDPVNNVVYVAAKLPEPSDPGGCPIDPVTGRAECEMTGGMVYAFSAANIRGIPGTLGSPIRAVPAEEPESLVFNPVNRMLYAANESKGTVTIVNAVNSNGVPEGPIMFEVPIFSTPGFPVSGPNRYALACSPYEADKMAVGPDGSVYITDDKSRVAKIAANKVVGMAQIDLPGGDNTALYCRGEEPLQGLNTANNIAVMGTRLYVVSEQNTVTILDPAALTLKATISVPGAVHLDAIAVDESMNRVWITDEVGPSPNTGVVFVLQGACANGTGQCVK